MASTVRYYMEQTVPELEDLQKKGLFDAREITMIMRRRTDFEHRIQGRGAKPRDFLKYAEFEISLEKLRIKRRTRLRNSGLFDLKPSLSDWAGFRRIIFVFDRATRRFPADLEIWGQYIRFVKEKDAIKVVYRVFSKLLLLQPRNVDTWLLAAKYEFETNANAKGARDLYQRALRFNPESLRLWLSYAQFELTYVSKLLARRKVMGLLTDQQQHDDLQESADQLQKRLAAPAVDGIEANEDSIALAADDGDDDALKAHLALLPEADINVLGNPDSNPVLKGDIALTVFDLCVPELCKHAGKDNKETCTFEMATQFLDMFDKFDNLNRAHLYLHVLTYLQTHYPASSETVMLDITLPLRNVAVTDASLAENLQLSVNKYMAYKLKAKKAADKAQLTAKYVDFLTTNYLDASEGVSERTQQLLKAIIKKCS